MQKWLENFAYRINLSWWIFAFAGLITMIISLLTVSWQTWSTATKNPVDCLMHE
jgi:putative ABC transport system permease protein